MREDFTDLLCLESGLRKICIIDNDAFDIRFCCCLAAHTRIQLSENRVDYTSPIDVAVIHETIEHILIACKQLAECRGRIIGSIFHREEREEHEQLQPWRQVNLQFGFLTEPMTLLCILMLFIMVDMLFIALLASLFAKNSWSSPIICLFLFMAKGFYVFCLTTLI